MADAGHVRREEQSVHEVGTLTAMSPRRRRRRSLCGLRLATLELKLQLMRPPARGLGREALSQQLDRGLRRAIAASTLDVRAARARYRLRRFRREPARRRMPRGGWRCRRAWRPCPPSSPGTAYEAWPLLLWWPDARCRSYAGARGRLACRGLCQSIASRRYSRGCRGRDHSAREGRAARPRPSRFAESDVPRSSCRRILTRSPERTP